MKLKLTLTLVVVIFTVIFSCKKNHEVTGSNKIEVGQTTTENISYTSVEAITTITNLGGNSIIQHGHCWSTESEPTIQVSKSSLGELNQPSTYKSEIKELLDNTTYYIRSYLTYTNGTVYGTEQSITTLKSGKPVVTTNVVSNVTLYSAQCGGVALADSGLSVLSKGVCWDTAAVFSIENNLGITNDGDSLGTFISEITDLQEGVNYNVKAYATNAKGTTYGEIKQFSTVAITLPEVLTSDITDITINSALSGGNVTGNGSGTVSLRGIVWSTNQDPTIDNNEGLTENGTGIGTFTSSLTNLQDGIFYYIRSYATNEKGTAYGEQISFQTIGIGFPILTTNNVINVTPITASCGGDISSAGNGSITVRGICWNLTGSPNLDNNINFTTDGSGIGNFSSSLTGLIEGTQYYVVAYATNEEGTAYGLVKSFTTVNINAPTVTTTSASNVTTSSATAGGNVTDGGNQDVTQRGVCWNTNSNPTLENNIGFTNDGTGTGTYVSTINDLNDSTLYYFRAYAINIEGTGYGEIKQFTTVDIGLPSVLTHVVTNILQTIATSGGNVTNDGNSSVTARGVCWSTNANPTLSDDHTVNGTGTGIFISNITGLIENTNYYIRAYATNSEGTAYGIERTFTTLPEQILPTVTTETVTNITQTTAISGGIVTLDGGATVIARGVCWSTSINPTISNSHTIDGTGTGPFTSNITGLTANTQYYVRAYATNSVGTAYGAEIAFTTLYLALPTVTTDDATNITHTTATSGGNVTDDGGADVTARGVCWSISSNPTLSDSHTTDGAGTGTFVSNITGLTESTLYHVRAYATNSVGTAYGNEISFTTIATPWVCGDILSYVGQDYTTVLIGTQCWIAENLNVGIRIDGTQEQTYNGQVEKYCYDNIESNCDTYGGLYQWDEMMEYTTAQGAQGICPNGWHIPTDDEWKILEGNTDTQYGVGDPEWDGNNERGYDTGINLKNTSGWIPSGNGNNTFGFTALPGGYCNSDGAFNFSSIWGYWQSSTEFSSSFAWIRYLGSDFNGAFRNSAVRQSGYSVRCLKD